MADQELAIVIRIRDQLTAELKRIEGVIGTLGSTSRSAFAQANAETAKAAQSMATVSTVSETAQQKLAGVGQAVQAIGRAGPELTKIKQDIQEFGAGLETPFGAGLGGVFTAQELGIERAAASSKELAASLGRVGSVGFGAFARVADGAKVLTSATAGTETMAQRARAALAKIGEGRVFASVEQAFTRLRTTGELTAVRIADGFRRSTASIRAAFQSILPVFSVGGAAFIAKASIDRASEFSKAIANISTIADESIGSLDKLRERVIALSKEHGVDRVEQAKGLYFIISSGARDAAEALEILEASTRLATAGLSDAKATADILTSTLNAYGSSNISAERAADVLFKTVELGKAEITNLSESFGRVLPLGAALGVSFEELSAFLAALTLKGLDTAESVTALRGILRAMLDPTREGKKLIEELGVSFNPAGVAAKGLAGVLIELREATGDNTEKLEQIFPEVRGLIGALSVLEDGGANVSAILKEIRNDSGAVARALGKQLQDPAVQATRVMNAMRTEFSESFGSGFFAAVQEAIDRMGGFDAAITKVSESAKKLGTTFGEMFPVVINLGNVLIGTFDAATSGLDFFAKSLGAFAEKISGDIDFSELGARLKAEFQENARETKAALDRVGGAIKATLGIGVADEASRGFAAVAKESERGLGDVRAQFDLTRGIIADLEADLGVIPERVSFLLANISDKGVATRVIEQIRAETMELRDNLDGARGSSALLKRELAGKITNRIAELDREASEFESGLRDARGEAELLGITDLSKLPAGFEELRAKLELSQNKLAENRKEVAKLKVELKTLELPELVVEAKPGDARGFGLEVQRALEVALASVDVDAASGAVAKRLSGEIRSALAREDIVTAERLFSARERVELTAAARAAAKDVVGTISSVEGLKESIKKAVNLEDSEKGRARAQAYVLALLELSEANGRLVADYPELRRELAEFTRGLFDSADAAKAAAAEAKRLKHAASDLPSSATVEILLVGANAASTALRKLSEDRKLLEGQAEALEIKTKDVVFRQGPEPFKVPVEMELSDENLVKEIDRARAKADNANLAITLGLKVGVDDRELARVAEEAALKLAEVQARVRRAELEREAVKLEIDVQTPNLEAKLAEARGKIDAFGDAVSQLQEDHPIVLSAAQNFAGGLAAEFGAVASGAKEAGEAAKDFITNLLVGTAQAIIQQRALELAAKSVSAALNEPLEVTRAALGLQVDQTAAAAAGAALTTASTTAAATLTAGAGGAATALTVGAGSAATTLSLGGTGAATALAGGASAAAGRLLTGGTATATAMVLGATKAAAILAAVKLVGVAAQGAVVPAKAGRIVSFAAGAALMASSAAAHVTAFARGSSNPYLDTVGSRATVAPLEMFRGSAIVPVSGGGVETPDGRHLPLARKGGELVVRAAAGGVTGALQSSRAPGSGPMALFRESGPESVMRTYPVPGGSSGGSPGLKSSSGAILPLTRVSGGRLGVDDGASSHPRGGGSARGSRSAVLPFASGGTPALSSPGSEPARVPAATRGGASPTAHHGQSSEPQQGGPVSLTINATFSFHGNASPEAVSAVLANKRAIIAMLSEVIESNPKFRALFRDIES